MTALQGAVDATFAAFARRPDTIVGFGETRIHTETAAFELRASEVANPRAEDHLALGGAMLPEEAAPSYQMLILG